MYNTKIPKRSISYPSQCQPTGDLSLNNVLVDQIKQLQGLPQPVQRTPEWYEFRNGLLSASSLWKAIGSQSQINSIIYEKCKAFNEEPVYQQYGTGTAMHWGVKYEPVTVQIYEDLYQTEVGEFGCIRHPTYSFIGASPDGINIKPNSVKFGSMLEIKNIVNREITGIPKEDYWIQTQIQMETCDLDNCDFVETRIKEYEKEDEFYANTTNSDYRGIVLYFIKNDFSQNAEPIYHYMPLNVPLDRENITKWIDADIELARQDELVLFNTIYWYLDEFSCVLIERNRSWFSSAIVKFKEVWDIIEKEKVDGYEHRSPKKKVNKLGASNVDTRVHTIPRQTKICLVKLDSN
jgi:putative phage-type endonuclease